MVHDELLCIKDQYFDTLFNLKGLFHFQVKISI